MSHFTSFFADGFNGALGFGKMTPEEMKAAFDKIDKDGSGSLDKTELSDALREAGKSESDVQRMLDNMTEESLNFEEFQALIEGKAQAYTTNVSLGGYDVPMPNFMKVHDIPLFGALTSATQNLVTDMASGAMGAAFGSAFGKMTDEELKEKFEQIDTDKGGTLDATEIAAALRELKCPEKDIKTIRDQVGDKQLDFEAFKALVKGLQGGGDGGGGKPASSIHDTPGLGHFTLFFADGFGGAFGFGKMTPEEMKAAFDKIDEDGSGTLDKTELANALRETGKSEREIQKFIDNMNEDSLNFEEFQALLEGKAQPYTTNIGGVDVPNLAKVHDIPILGGFTSAASNLFGSVAGASMSLVGNAFGAAFGGLTEEELKAKFTEIDTDGGGTLDAKEVSVALRNLKMSEADIKKMTDSIGDGEVDFEGFKKLVGFKG